MKTLSLTAMLICVFPALLFVRHAAGEDTSGETGAEQKVALTLGNWQDVEAHVAENHGRVVVLDIWSTSCLPCMKEFPGLVKLHEAHPDDVVCVSLCVDYAGIRSRPPERYRERVETFLTKQKATFRNYLSTTASDELFEAIDLPSIPAVLVFGRDGKLAKRFDSSLLEDGEEEAFTYQDDVNPFVEAQLGTR